MLKDEDKIIIFDTKKENNLVVHFTKELPKELNGTFHASVNQSKRLNAAKNHSATHLLHHALKSVLGDHVEQKGSLVQPNALRFDFSHFSKVSDKELAQIETLVLKEIEDNYKLEEYRNIPIQEAKSMGATALFGEKYGEEVRVIKFNDSLELCGGTHISSTNEIGMFTIISESAVASGIRRIEAICGDAADRYFRDRSLKYEAASTLLKKPKNLEQSIQDLVDKNQILNKKIESFQKDLSKRIKADLKNKITPVNGVNFLGASVELTSSSVKDILFQLKSEQSDFVGIIGNIEDSKCGMHVIISENLVAEKDWNASAWIKEISNIIQGGGGGQAFYASAGGKNSNGIPQAINELKKKL